MFAVSGERCDSGSLAGLGVVDFLRARERALAEREMARSISKRNIANVMAQSGKAAVICLAVAVKIAVKSGKHGFTFGAVGDDCADALYKSGIGFLRYGTEVG